MNDDEIGLRLKELVNFILDIAEKSADRSFSLEAETDSGKYTIEIKVIKIG